ncbi:hypothetical protein NB640_10060 [Oxalobacter vibrioformis]|uniref:Uncharacterized protein n=1 Tax=Oxalobacter vibrioformis TaxID=933080 RepID=A0A9E9P3X4_9BURK|nr:hypothetical protein [Oxalobacter vibrioformis]WAW09571.1 hypothetical protein NB640_10060 [Oxalobacter vibrioformis]
MIRRTSCPCCKKNGNRHWKKSGRPPPKAYRQYNEIDELKKSEIIPIGEESSFALINLEDRKWPERAAFSLHTASPGGTLPAGTPYILILSYFSSRPNHPLLAITQDILASHHLPCLTDDL